VLQEVTSLRFDESEGLLLAAGTSAGQVLLYDLRSSIPLRIKDHMYGSPIVDIKWHESVSNASKHLVTADSHVVRIWDPQTVSTDPPFTLLFSVQEK
jgi:ribosome biogenesis protein ENP2